MPLMAEAPSEDFWQFYSEFADDQGQLLDPDALALPTPTADDPAPDSPAPDSPDEEETP